MAINPQKLIILDRDGVINHDSDAYIKSPAEWEPIDGSLEAIAQLNQLGYTVVVATNQSGLARGLFDMHTLNRIHDKMHKLAAKQGAEIDAVFFCPHVDDDACECRKPKAGLFHEIGRRFNISLQGVIGVGDSLRDLQAISSVGGQPILVLTGKGQKTYAQGGLPANTRIFDNLLEAVQWLKR